MERTTDIKALEEIAERELLNAIIDEAILVRVNRRRKTKALWRLVEILSTLANSSPYL